MISFFVFNVPTSQKVDTVNTSVYEPTVLKVNQGSYTINTMEYGLILTK